MEYTYTKEQIKNGLKYQIANDNNKAIHALMTIYSYQTDEEQSDGHTIEYNGVGFSGVDSQILSSFAEQYHTKGFLSEKQMNLLKRIMPRYANQLLGISFSKGNFEKVGRKWRIVRKTTVRVDND
jgi:hypothetical protein